MFCWLLQRLVVFRVYNFINMNANNIVISRHITGWRFYNEPFMLQLLLILHCESNYAYYKGVDKGSVLTSLDKLSKQLGVTRSKVRHMLDKIERNGDIEKMTDHKKFGTVYRLRTFTDGSVDRSPESKESNEFTPPTIEQVQKIMQSEAESQKFMNFYESNGWRVGSNKMHNWQASAKKWKSTIKQETKEEEYDRIGFFEYKEKYGDEAAGNMELRKAGIIN